MKSSGKWKRLRVKYTPRIPGGLTKQNIDVLRVLGFGMSYKEASEVLGVSRKTVEYHSARICTRLNTDLNFLPRIAWAFGLAPLAACLMLLAGCSTKAPAPAPVPVPIPAPIPPLPPMPRANLRAAPLVTAAPAPGSVALAWFPSPSSGVGGYKLYQGVKSRTYTVTMTLGNITNATISAIPGVTNFFSVTALGYSGGTVGESPFSNEAVYSPKAQKKTVVIINGIVEASPDMNIWTNVWTFPDAYLTNTIDPNFLQFWRVRATIDHFDSP